MVPIIYPYKIGSNSAKILAKKLNTKCIKENGLYKYKKGHLIVNWGNSKEPDWYPRKWITGVWVVDRMVTLNMPISVGTAQNKLYSFMAFLNHNISCPKWTIDNEVAEEWIKEGIVVVCRKLLNSHSGKGIVIAENETQLCAAPLYVQYKEKKKEFRVHVFNKEIIDVQQKRIKKGAKEEEGFNSLIRSHHNGWVYTREDIVEPEELRSLAIKAVNALGLDFGAVDIIWNKAEDECYVLEINTAPGLEGSTINSYAKVIKEYAENNF